MINEGKSTEIVDYKELGDGLYPYPDIIIYIPKMYI